jgi:hypothetical protein
LGGIRGARAAPLGFVALLVEGAGGAGLARAVVRGRAVLVGGVARDPVLPVAARGAVVVAALVGEPALVGAFAPVAASGLAAVLACLPVLVVVLDPQPAARTTGMRMVMRRRRGMAPVS